MMFISDIRVCIFFLGSNGQDFSSRCHLEREACDRRAELSVRYAGKCNPCQGFECQSPKQECHVKDLDLGRTPTCICDRDCANETAPICASNGKTVSISYGASIFFANMGKYI